MKWLKRTTSIFFVSVLLVFAQSCSKQSPDTSSEEVQTSREIQRLDACSKVNFNKGVLLYQNVKDLFVCTKWDEQFPHMFGAMNKVSAASWNHLMGPIDANFVSNQQRRDRVFKNIRELDAKGGLDNLSYVIVALNETNFFDSTKAMFACVDNPTDPVCATRAGKIPEKRSLKKIIELIDADPETIDNISLFVKAFVKALDGRSEPLRAEINKFRASPLYVPVRLKVVDAIANKARNGFSDEDREFVSKVLLTGNAKGDVPWIYQWIQDQKMSREKFRDLVEYPVLTNPEFVGEMKGLELAYDGGLACSMKSSTSPNNLIEFDFKTHISNYVSIIRNKDYKSFYDYSTETIFGLKASTEVCSELEKNHYNVNIIKLLTHFSDFLGEKKFYDLVKFLMAESTAKGDPDKTFAENLYLFDLLTGDIFSSANALNTNIISSTRNFYPLVYDVARALPPEAYVNLGEYIAAIARPENDARFKGVADFWTFFTPEEKNFLFNFVDRHFDKGVDYVLLFDFYTKFLDDLRDVQPSLRDAWIGTADKEEMSYLTLQDLFTQFAGKETLLDFKKFFSRDQIIKVLEVISNGQGINQMAKDQLAYMKSDNYVLRSQSDRYVFKVSYNPGADPDYDAKAVIDCMTKFSDIQNGFYELVRNLPAACSKVTEANVAFRMYGWMNSIEGSYLEFKQASDPKNSLLDSNGILSPYMLNNSLGLVKVLDNLLGPVGSTIPTKNGGSYLLNSANYHLNEKQAAPLVEQNLQWLNSFLSVSPEINTQHRNALVKSFTRKENFAYSNTVFANLGQLLEEYADWVKKGELTKAQTRSLGTFDPNLTCAKFVNQFVAPYPCPSTDVVKEHGNKLITSLATIWDPSFGSPIASVIKAVKPGEGLDIPLNSPKTHKYRLSLRETFKYFYDTTDKSWPVNRQVVTFTNDDKATSTETITTAEGIESVIREVRFGNNYLGAAFLNYVVHGDDYNKDVANRKMVTQACFKIPGVRCGRPMSESDMRMLRNALNVFDALSDINNGRKQDDRLQYGDFMKTFEQSLLQTSSKEAQQVKLFPLSDEVLKKHNGVILDEMMLLTMPSNVGRVIRDRVGRSRDEFEAFIAREDFKRVDRALLYGFDLPTTGPSAERLLNKLVATPAGGGQNLFGNTVDWVNTLSYSEERLLEDTIARLMVVGSYLGTPDIVFGTKTPPTGTMKYKDNNLFQVFLALEKLVDYWPTLKNYFPGDVKLIEMIKPINTGLYFLTNKLNSTTDPSKNTAYLALNDLFMVLQTTLFDQLPNPQINGNRNSTTQGLNLLLAMFKDPQQVSKTYTVGRADYKYLDVFHANNAAPFYAISQNLKRMTGSSQVDFTALRDYLEFTSKNVLSLAGDTVPRENYHYDEPASLIRYLNKKSASGQSNFMIVNQKFFVENSDQISQMLDDLLPCVKIKEVKTPLLFN